MVASATEPACLKHFVDIITYEMKWSGGILTRLPEHPGDSYKNNKKMHNLTMFSTIFHTFIFSFHEKWVTCVKSKPDTAANVHYY